MRHFDSARGTVGASGFAPVARHRALDMPGACYPEYEALLARDGASYDQLDLALLAYMFDGDTVVGNDGSDVADFVTSVLAKAGRWGEPERLLSVIFNGENAWEWYSQDHDAKPFDEIFRAQLRATYAELNSALVAEGFEPVAVPGFGDGGWTPVTTHMSEIGGPVDGGTLIELDATGDQIPLTQYIAIADPPPPAGSGTPSIFGNRTELSKWTPNSVALTDDGAAPDVAAGDGIWTLAFTFVPGTGLQYKYPIGHPGDSWGGTEEYPRTNRGYTVPSDGTRRVRLRDIFAGRPDPSGTMAGKTSVTIEE
jgi:hypothetical protein